MSQAAALMAPCTCPTLAHAARERVMPATLALRRPRAAVRRHPAPRRPRRQPAPSPPMSPACGKVPRPMASITPIPGNGLPFRRRTAKA